MSVVLPEAELNDKQGEDIKDTIVRTQILRELSGQNELSLYPDSASND